MFVDRDHDYWRSQSRITIPPPESQSPPPIKPRRPAPTPVGMDWAEREAELARKRAVINTTLTFLGLWASFILAWTACGIFWGDL